MLAKAILITFILVMASLMVVGLTVKECEDEQYNEDDNTNIS